MTGESLRNDITKVADGLRLKAPSGPPRVLPRDRAIELKVARTLAEMEDCLGLRFQVYDRMGYLEDRISGCPSQLEIDRYDVYDNKGTIHFIAKDHESGEIAGTVRLILARGLGKVRESVIGSPPSEILHMQDRLIREIARREADTSEERAVLQQKINAPGFFGSLPILQSAEFHEKSRAILMRSQDICELSRLVVGPRYRGLGVSKVLVRAVLATALDLKKDRVLLECVPTHASMYEKFGFELIKGTHSRAQELDQEAVAMQLALQNTPLQRFRAVANNDLKMIKDGSGPHDPKMLAGSKHLCLCSNSNCWPTGSYSERTKLGCPLRDLHRRPR
jgi:predicted GNAT family N-acyltransferase